MMSDFNARKTRVFRKYIYMNILVNKEQQQQQQQTNKQNTIEENCKTKCTTKIKYQHFNQ